MKKPYQFQGWSTLSSALYCIHLCNTCSTTRSTPEPFPARLHWRAAIALQPKLAHSNSSSVSIQKLLPATCRSVTLAPPNLESFSPHQSPLLPFHVILCSLAWTRSTRELTGMHKSHMAKRGSQENSTCMLCMAENHHQQVGKELIPFPVRQDPPGCWQQKPQKGHYYPLPLTSSHAFLP